MEEIPKGKLMETKPKAFGENMMITLDMMCSKFVSNSIDKIIEFTCEKIRTLNKYKEHLGLPGLGLLDYGFLLKEIPDSD